MRFTSLWFLVFAGGVVFVAAVALFNYVQIRRAQRRLGASGSAGRDTATRLEPTLGPGSTGAYEPDDFEPEEMPVAPRIERAGDSVGASEIAAAPGESAVADASVPAPLAAQADDRARPQPDSDIECVILLQPANPAGAGAIAAGLHARLGKPMRWFGRRAPDAPWQLLHPATPGEFAEFAACLLLADRSGAASQPLLDVFVRLAGEIAASLPGAFRAPDTANEAGRAEMLDRICADFDVQIGLTVLKPGLETIPGTRLRAVAEGAGFRLTGVGRFDYIQEDSGAVLFALQNCRAEPFSAEALRTMSTPGAVIVLDVPRVADPVRIFDQMKLVAKRMTVTLDATLVDDNRRPLDDVALAAIRQHVQATARALSDVNIVPGSSRALALFGG